jgi:AraC family transcriptional regulator
LLQFLKKAVATMVKTSYSSKERDPQQPIASSQALGWESILVEEFQNPPGGMELQSDPEHTIALSLAAKPNRIHQVFGARHYTGLYRKGDLAITPAGVKSAYHSEGEDHYLYVRLPSQFINKVASEAIAIEPNRIELTPEFRVRNLEIEQILMLLRSELHKGGGCIGKLYAESLANALAVHLLRDYSNTRSRVVEYEGGLSERQIILVTEYINEHLDREIKLADLAQLIDISQFHFSRLFKKSLSISPHQHIIQQRIERAKQLLKQRDLSVAEVAFLCGFNSQSHLGKAFREATGITPKAFREEK